MKEKSIETKINICQQEELSDEFQLLINKAKEQSQHAYAPYSNFCVGSAILLENKQIIGGNNQENASYPAGICAERVSLFYANSQFPSTIIKALAIAAQKNGKFTEMPINPCGICLQALLESENKQQENIQLLLFGTKEIHIINSIKECLPLSFRL